MSTDADRNASITKLGELIKDIQTAMLTTIADDGSLRSRPMTTLRTQFDGHLWFFTGMSTDKVAETQRNPHVNLSFADPGAQSYVSVAGTAHVVRDHHTLKELWNPILKASFPAGLDDPDLALLKVEVNGAEYWDAPSNRIVLLASFVKALATGERFQPGDNREIDVAEQA